MAAVAALSAVVLWGISFVATRAALTELSPVTLVFTRFAMGTALLLALAAAARGRPAPAEELAVPRAPIPPPRDAWPALLLMGFLGVFVHQMIQAHALELTTAVNTGWLIGVTPIWSAILAAVFLRESIRGTKLAGLLVGFAGAALVVTRGRLSADVLALPATLGDFLILASTVNWAVFSVVGRKTLARLGSLRAMSFAMLAGWAMLIPFFLARRGWTEYTSVGAFGWGAVLFLGIGCSGLGYFFWYFALERLETTRVAAFLYVEPLVTLAAAVALLGEPVPATTIVGGVFVLAGVFLVQRAGITRTVISPLPARDARS